MKLLKRTVLFLLMLLFSLVLGSAAYAGAPPVFETFGTMNTSTIHNPFTSE